MEKTKSSTSMYQVNDIVRVTKAQVGYDEWTVGLVGVVKKHCPEYTSKYDGDMDHQYLLWFPGYGGTKGHGGDTEESRRDHWYVGADYIEKAPILANQTVRITNGLNAGKTGLVLGDDGEGEGFLPWWVVVGESYRDDAYSGDYESWALGTPHNAADLQPVWVDQPEPQAAEVAYVYEGDSGDESDFVGYGPDNPCEDPDCTICHPEAQPRLLEHDEDGIGQDSLDESEEFIVVDPKDDSILATFEGKGSAIEDARSYSNSEVACVKVYKLVYERHVVTSYSEAEYR